MKRYFPPSELLIEPNGAVYHLGVKPEQLAEKIILVGDPNRVPKVAAFFDEQECDISAREFRTITGTYKGKRISVVGTGIGCDNIDIVVNELDALANIDFATRYEKDTFKQLQMVRIGTCGGLQEYCPTGSFICSVKSVGFDGLLNFYAGRNEVCDLEFEATPQLVAFALCPLHNPRRQRACGAHSTGQYGAWRYHCLWRFLWPARPSVARASGIPKAERTYRVVRVQGTAYYQLRDGELGSCRPVGSYGAQGCHGVPCHCQPPGQESHNGL